MTPRPPCHPPQGEGGNMAGGGGGAKLVILVPVHSGDWSIRSCFNTLVSKEVTGDFFGPGDKL